MSIRPQALGGVGNTVSDGFKSQAWLGIRSSQGPPRNLLLSTSTQNSTSGPPSRQRGHHLPSLVHVYARSVFGGGGGLGLRHGLQMRRLGPKEERDTMVATEAEFSTVSSLLLSAVWGRVRPSPSWDRGKDWGTPRSCPHTRLLDTAHHPMP